MVASPQSNYATGRELIAQYERPFYRTKIDSTIPEHLRFLAARAPDHAAIVARDGAITYGQLDRITDEMAAHLWDVCGPELEVVPFLDEGGPSAILSALAIMKAGKIFLALSTRQPIHHIQLLLKKANARLLLTSADSLPLARSVITGTCNNIVLSDAPATGLHAPTLDLRPDDTALLLQTSGSTGGSKLVMRSHAHALHTAWSNGSGLYLNPQQRVSAFASMSYGLGSNTVLETLLSGATLATLEVREQSVEEIVASLRELEVTVLKIPAPLLLRILEHVSGHQDLPALRVVRCGGQTLHHHVAALFLQKMAGQCVLINGYSASEASSIANMVVTSAQVKEGEPIAVGRPVVDKEIFILGEDRNRLKDGEIGEIAVRSRFISHGYWQSPELTEKKFLPDPDGGSQRIYLTGDTGRIRPDGLLEHLGREAHFTKIRGYSVQLAQVEEILARHERVEATAVVTSPDSAGDDQLVAYVAGNFENVTSNALRAFIAERLPPFMVPSRIIFLERLPLLENGKVDRRALPAPGFKRPQLDVVFLSPQTDNERKLAAIWAEVLGLDQVGIHDPFDQLGGHSLQAMQILNRIEQTFHVSGSYRALFNHPTVAGMARILAADDQTGNEQDPLDDDIVTLRL
ncbi:MAG: non-ribosomal peptide synthetase [Candidatus Promineifilaceae bacterium]